MAADERDSVNRVKTDPTFLPKLRTNAEAHNRATHFVDRSMTLDVQTVLELIDEVEELRGAVRAIVPGATNFGKGISLDTLDYVDRLAQLWAQRGGVTDDALKDLRIQLRFAAGAVARGEAPKLVAEEQVEAVRALVGSAESDAYTALMGEGGMARFSDVIESVLAYGIPWAFRRAARTVAGVLDAIAAKRGAPPVDEARVTCAAGEPHKFTPTRDVMTCTCGHGAKQPCHSFGPHKFALGGDVARCDVCGLGRNTEDHRAT